jgi:hypothetical protein
LGGDGDCDYFGGGDGDDERSDDDGDEGFGDIAMSREAAVGASEEEILQQRGVFSAHGRTTGMVSTTRDAEPVNDLEHNGSYIAELMWTSTLWSSRACAAWSFKAAMPEPFLHYLEGHSSGHFARDFGLPSVVVNQIMRRRTCAATTASVRADSVSARNYVRAVNDPNFAKALAAAKHHPKTEKTAKLLKEVMSFISSGSAATPLSPGVLEVSGALHVPLEGGDSCVSASRWSTDNSVEKLTPVLVSTTRSREPTV